MSIRSKIILILLGVVLLYAGVDNGLLRIVASRVFQRWELEEAEKRVGEVAARVEAYVENLEDKARIWASLDEVFAFVTDGSEAIVQRNLEQALESTGVDVFYVCDADGQVLWSSAVDPSTGADMRLKTELPAEALGRGHQLLVFRPDEKAVSGVMMTKLWPLLVSSYAIPDRDGRSLGGDGRFRYPLHGTIILGKFVGPELRASIGHAAGVEISIVSKDEANLTEEEAELVDQITAGEVEIPSRVAEDGRLHLFRAFEDLRTKYPLLLRVSLDREITARGERAVRIALLSTVATALLILFVLLRLLQRIVIHPLSTLTTKAVEIGKTDDTTIRTELERDDEIGQLSSEFDRMLDELAASRAQLVDTARLAGMSEIATGVLHNVGNVLNSVNVSASLATKKAGELSTGDLEKMAEILREHEDDIGRFLSEERGKHMLPFLYEVTDNLVGQKRQILAEMNSLEEGIDHIAELVRSQQCYAGTKGVFELASLQDEVDSALRICKQALAWPADVDVDHEYEELPTVKVDRRKLMEILVNLIQNARQALQDSDQVDKRITLRVLRAGENQARIEVMDNGMGIPADNLARIFNHGFTTRGGGHGFGLHISANAATEMNASLQVRSDGPGKGATFFVDIPIKTGGLVAAA